MPTPDEIDAHLSDVVSRYPNVPLDVVRRMLNTESGGRSDAVSPKGAKGLMQLMPDTAREMGVTDPNDWRQNVEGGVKYLSHNIDTFGDVPLGVAAYHAGPGAVRKAGNRIPDTNDGIMRTADYVQRIAGQTSDTGAPVPRSASKVKPRAGDDDALDMSQYGDRIPLDFTAGAPAKKPGVWEDTKTMLGLGTNMAAQDVREGVRQVLGDNIVEKIDKLGDALGMADVDKQKEQLEAKLSPEQSAANAKDWISEDGDGMHFGPAWTDPRSYYGGVVQSLPEQVLTMVPALRIAKAGAAIAEGNVFRAAAARGISRESAAKLAEKKSADALANTATVAGGVLEGLAQGGQSAREVRDDILKMPDDVLDTSQAFKALVDQHGGDRAAAKQQLANDQASQAYVTAGVATALFGGQGDRVLAKLVSGRITGKAVGRAASGAVGEGLLEEAPQSYLSQVAQNVAEQKADSSIPTTKGALNQAVGGAVQGGLQGGAMGVAFGHGEKVPAATTPPPTQNIPADAVPPPVDGAPRTPFAAPKTSVDEARTAYEESIEALKAKARAAGVTDDAALDKVVADALDGRITDGSADGYITARERILDKVGRGTVAPVQSAATGQEGDRGRPADGLPFKAKIAAFGERKRQGMQDTHDVVEVGENAFVLRPKDAQATQTPAETVEAPRAPETVAPAMQAAPTTGESAVASTPDAAHAPEADAATRKVSVARNEQDGTKFDAQIGEYAAGTKRALLVDPAGGYFWGERNQTIDPAGGYKVTGEHADAEPALFGKMAEARAAAAAVPQTKRAPVGKIEAKANSAADISGGMGSMGKGITESMYGGLLDALKAGKTRMAGVKDPVLARAKPAFDAGLIKSADDIQRFEKDGYPAISAKPAAAEKPVANQAPAISPQTDIGRDRDGAPFANRVAALSTLRTKGLGKTHAVVQLAKDQFVLRPKTPAATAVAVDVSRETPAVEHKTELDAAAHEAATSPHNELPEPTEAQKTAGNYQKGHADFQGLPLSIENPKGSERSGTTKSGKKWSNTMRHHYGYLKGTVGADKDHIDAFVGGQHDSPKVFVIDQVKPDRTFDEHKVMLGFTSREQAKRAYLANYSTGWKGLGKITETTVDGFKKWLAEGQTKEPFAEQHMKPRTEKQIANDDRLRAAAKAKMKLRPETDTLITAIAKLGGLDPKYRKDITGESKGENFKVPFVGHLFANDAASSANGGLDVMASDLAQYGYMTPEEMADTDGGVAALSEKIRDEIMGRPHYSLNRDESDAVAARQQFEAEDAETAGYNDLTADEAAAADALLEDAFDLDGKVMNDDEVAAWLEEPRIDAKTAAGLASEGEGRGAEARQDAAQERPAAADTDTADEVAPSLELKSESNDDILAREAAQKKTDDDARAADDAAAAKARADGELEGFTLAGSDRTADTAAAAGQTDIFATPVEAAEALPPAEPDPAVSIVPLADVEAEPAKAAERIEDFGEKIGGARKDTARKLGSRGAKVVGDTDDKPAWARPYVAMEETRSVGSYPNRTLEKTGKWQLFRANQGHSGPVSRVSRATFDSEAEAMAGVPLAELARNHRVYGAVGKDGKTTYGIYRRIGERKRALVKGGFDTEEAAMTHMVQNAPAIIEHKFAFPEKPWLDHIERTGPQTREGDVGPSKFKDTFGFRGGEFGNWNMGSDGQAALNHAYDALIDLANAIGVPPKALSLNGELAVAFGARGTGGKGSAVAHYEPGAVVINLTKIKGAGSLAHEWFHALDDYLTRSTDTDSTRRARTTLRQERPYATYGMSSMSTARPELMAAFKHVVDTMTTKSEGVAVDENSANRRLSSAHEGVKRRLDGLRSTIARDRQYGAKKKAATEAQLKQWDELAARALAGDRGADVNVPPPKGSSRFSFGHSSSEVVRGLNDIYKAVTGRSFDTADNSSDGRQLYWAIDSVKNLNERLAAAMAGTIEQRKSGTSYLDESKRIDDFRASSYWSTVHEMGARAFESYIFDRIAYDKGERSDYLVHAVENKYYASTGFKPYPEGSERSFINAAFDQLFQTIETKEGDDGNVPMFSRASDAVLGTFRDLASHKEAFGIEHSRAKGIEDIVKSIAPTLQVTALDESEINDPDVTALFGLTDPVSGARATITRERGGIVILDVASWGKGNNGAVPYQIAADYAHNNGLVFRGDDSMTPDSVRRRTEQMLSSALYWKTTKHIAPGPSQVDPGRMGREKLNTLDWRKGDEDHNLLELLRASYNNVRNALPEIEHYAYDSSHGRFFDTRTGATVTERDIATLGNSDAARAALVGSRTISRAILVQSALRDEVSRAGHVGLDAHRADGGSAEAGRDVQPGGNGRADGADAAAARPAGSLPPVLAKLLYSRDDGPASAGLSTSAVRKQVDAIAAKWQNAPAITVVSSVDELPFDAPDDARGAYFQGRAWLVASNIHSAADAQFTLFHEVLGHAGMRGAFGNELAPALRAVAAANQNVRAAAAAWKRDNPMPDGMRPATYELKAIEEALADVAGSGKTITGFGRLIAALQKALRAVGLDKVADWFEGKTDAQALAMLAESKSYIAQGEKAEAADTSDTAAASRPAPVWRSPLTEAIAAKAPFAKNGSIDAEQLSRWLTARATDGTFKKDELAWSGLTDWLAATGGKVTREQVDAFMAQNGVQVTETTLTGAPDKDAINKRLAELKAQRASETDRGRINQLNAQMLQLRKDMEDGVGNAKFDGYVLPGGENYKELLLTLPTKETEAARAKAARLRELEERHYKLKALLDAELARTQSGGEHDVYRVQQLETAVKNAKMQVNMVRQSTSADYGVGFKSGHFDQPNILAHVRFNERTDADGKRVLFLEELQSDWAQKGRKEGFGTQDTGRTATGPITPGNPNPQPQRVVKVGVPAAPFVQKTEAWTALALKRMIRYAAENGFDKVAWTTGEQQAARYQLSKHVDSVNVWSNGEGGYHFEAKKDGRNVVAEPDAKGISASALADHIGKDLAKTAVDDIAAGKVAKYSGVDLDVGGGGMKAFYGAIVPNVANDVLKKLGGGRVSTVAGVVENGVEKQRYEGITRSADDLKKVLDSDYVGKWPSALRSQLATVYDRVKRGSDFARTIEGYGSAALAEKLGGKMVTGEKIGEQPGFDITPAMREQAMQGMPMFSRADKARDAIAGALKAQTVTDVSHRFANRMRDLRGIGLQSLGRRQITEIYRDDIPALKPYGELTQRMDADKNEAGAEADKLVRDWAKLKDEKQLADLMHDATKAGIDPDKALQKGDDAAAHAELKKRFDALAPDAKTTYREARDMYAAHYTKVQEAIKAKIARVMPDNQRRKEMLERMDANLFGKVKGVYFPLARFGDYLVVVKNAEGEKESITFAETLNEAEATRARLRSQFPASKGFTVGKVIKRKEFNAQRDAVSKGFLADLMGVLDQYDIGDQLQDAVNQLYLSSLPDLSWAKHGIHRKGTPGFSQDARRAFAGNMFHGARYLAKLRYADRLQDFMRSMQETVDSKVADEKYDSVAAQQVVDEMVKRHDAYMNPKTSSLSTALTSVGFIFHLGLSPASAMVNLAQTPMVAYPILAARYGWGKAASELMRASKLAMSHKNDLNGVLKGDELRAYDEAVRAGVIDVTLAHDLAGVASGDDQKTTYAMQPVMRAASFLFHHAEKFNRQATFLAAYRMARSAGQEHDEAVRTASEDTYAGHFDYTSGNRPRLMQGNVARVMLLFKQFGQNMIYTMARAAYLASKGDREAQKRFAGLLVTHAMGAGLLGLPAVTTLLSMASWLGGSDDDPWDAEVALRNMLAEAFGAKPAEVLVHGLSRLTPWDISSRVGLNSMIFPDIREGLEGADLAKEILSGMAGPVAAIGTSFLTGVKDIGQGNIARGLEDMAPSALRGPLKAARYATEGDKDRTGIQLVDEMTPLEEFGQALGFTPSRHKEASEGKGAVYNAEKQLNQRRQSLMTQWAHAKQSGDADATQEAIDDIKAFNEKNPSRRIAGAQLANSMRQREKREREAQGGMYLPKKHRDVADLGRFAVTE